MLLSSITQYFNARLGLPDASAVSINEDTAITFPKSVKSIGKSAFCETKWLESYPDDFVIVGNGFLMNYKGEDESVVIPNSVKIIGDYAFTFCKNLSAVTISHSVKSIGNNAFYYCGALKSITIPDSVKSIGESAFLNCTGLTAVVIPYSVKSIGAFAFADCTNLTEIKLPSSLERIDAYTFTECTSLLSITIPDSVKSIGHCAFSNCSSLTSVVIPDSVTSIEGGLSRDSAFKACTNLTSITIPECAVKEGYATNTFDDCKRLSTIIMNGIVYNIQNIIYDDHRKLYEDLHEAQKMLNARRFSAKVYAPIKNMAIVGYYFLTGDEDAESYIQKGALRILKCLIEVEDTAKIDLLFSARQFVTNNHIDKLIDYANEIGKSEIKALLIGYKEQNLKK